MWINYKGKFVLSVTLKHTVKAIDTTIWSNKVIHLLLKIIRKSVETTAYLTHYTK